ncbi:MAG: hypothetical protein KGY76_07205 [Candidatus Thermoplasmatota archaeon]|nr:hypothetical protein [Candidatus Thermoplasmatota archaeon]
MMKNSQEQSINYKTTSKNEARLLETIRSEGLLTFGVDEVKALTGWKKTRVHNTLSTLTKKGHLVKIKRNTYTLENEFFEKTFEVITDAIKPSYISFWTALSYYGFTEQQVNTIQLVSTKQLKELKIGSKSITITTFKPSRFFGYDNSQGFVLAEKEKALIDSLYQLEKCGGLEEYIKCLKNGYEGLDEQKFTKYLIRFENRSLISRTGFLLEELGLAEKETLKKLKEQRSKSYVLLDPGGDEIQDHNSDWNVKINREVQQI